MIVTIKASGIVTLKVIVIVAVIAAIQTTLQGPGQRNSNKQERTKRNLKIVEEKIAIVKMFRYQVVALYTIASTYPKLSCVIKVSTYLHTGLIRASAAGNGILRQS